ncbi:hypothetical protein B0H21DRAFT_712836 [Amylocystis lapponica]|nr:hypothetical protein B0H21DRAFT_712836 [Amylocystis lapponica]
MSSPPIPPSVSQESTTTAPIDSTPLPVNPSDPTTIPLPPSPRPLVPSKCLRSPTPSPEGPVLPKGQIVKPPRKKQKTIAPTTIAPRPCRPPTKKGNMFTNYIYLIKSLNRHLFFRSGVNRASSGVQHPVAYVDKYQSDRSPQDAEMAGTLSPETGRVSQKDVFNEDSSKTTHFAPTNEPSPDIGLSSMVVDSDPNASGASLMPNRFHRQRMRTDTLNNAHAARSGSTSTRAVPVHTSSRPDKGNMKEVPVQDRLAPSNPVDHRMSHASEFAKDTALPKQTAPGNTRVTPATSRMQAPTASSKAKVVSKPPPVWAPRSGVHPTLSRSAQMTQGPSVSNAESREVAKQRVMATHMTGAGAIPSRQVQESSAPATVESVPRTKVLSGIDPGSSPSHIPTMHNSSVQNTPHSTEASPLQVGNATTSDISPSTHVPTPNPGSTGMASASQPSGPPIPQLPGPSYSHHGGNGGEKNLLNNIFRPVASNAANFGQIVPYHDSRSAIDFSNFQFNLVPPQHNTFAPSSENDHRLFTNDTGGRPPLPEYVHKPSFAVAQQSYYSSATTSLNQSHTMDTRSDRTVPGTSYREPNDQGASGSGYTAPIDNTGAENISTLAEGQRSPGNQQNHFARPLNATLLPATGSHRATAPAPPTTAVPSFNDHVGGQPGESDGGPTFGQGTHSGTASMAQNRRSSNNSSNASNCAANSGSFVDPSSQDCTPLLRRDLFIIGDHVVNTLKSTLGDIIDAKVDHALEAKSARKKSKTSSNRASHARNPPRHPSSSKHPTRSAHATSGSEGGDGDDADVESDDEFPKRKGTKIHRPDPRNKLQNAIRQHTLKLMGRIDQRSQFTNIPSEDVVKAFDPDQEEYCCDAENFRVDLFGTPRSPWNLSAAAVFTEDFIRTDKVHGPTTTFKEVQDMWIIHFASLKRQFQKHGTPQKDLRAAAQKHRRDSRRLTLFERRMKVAELNLQELEPDAVRILETLGPRGMSSDESGHESGHGEPTYYVTRKKWRSSELVDWLHVLDRVHLWSRYQGQYDATPGAWPHYRHSSLKDSNSAPVTHLPRTFYSPNWLSGCSTLMKVRISASDKIAYNLTHPDEITRRVVQNYDPYYVDVPHGMAGTSGTTGNL